MSLSLDGWNDHRLEGKSGASCRGFSSSNITQTAGANVSEHLFIDIIHSQEISDFSYKSIEKHFFEIFNYLIPGT